MSKIALIDGDIVAYRSAASCEPTKAKPERETLEQAIFRTNDLIYRIINTSTTSEYRLFLSGDRNFRKQLYPDYKANRAHIPKPVYLGACRDLLVREWGAEFCNGFEADDGIGMAHSERSVICSIDKDFKQIEGEHFNFVKNEFSTVDGQQAAFNFYAQMLEGDSSDNVRGVAGIGPVGARRILSDCSPEHMHSTVMGLYDSPERFFLTYRLLRILRSEEEWKEVEASISEKQGTEPTEGSTGQDTGDISSTGEG